MSATAYWDNDDKTVLVLKVTDPFSVDELIDVVDATADIFTNIHHPVVLLMDMSAFRNPPMGLISAIPRLANARGSSISVVSARYMVTQSPILEMVVRAFNRLYSPITLYRSMDDALQNIKAKLTSASRPS
jgi:hypothetical protein